MLKEFFERRDDDVASTEFDESFAFEAVEHLRHSEACCDEFVGQGNHINDELLLSGGAGGAQQKEVDKLLFEPVGVGFPQTTLPKVLVGADEVKVVDVERHVSEEDVTHFVFGDAEHLDFSHSSEGGRVPLSQPEETFGLHDGRGCGQFAEEIGSIVGTLFFADGSAGGADEVVTEFAIVHDGGTFGKGAEVEVDAFGNA